MTGWTIEELPGKLRACVDGDCSEDGHDLMRMAADEIERLQELADDLEEHCYGCCGHTRPGYLPPDLRTQGAPRR